MKLTPLTRKEMNKAYSVSTTNFKTIQLMSPENIEKIHAAADVGLLPNNPKTKGKKIVTRVIPEDSPTR